MLRFHYPDTRRQRRTVINLLVIKAYLGAIHYLSTGLERRHATFPLPRRRHIVINLLVIKACLWDVVINILGVCIISDSVFVLFLVINIIHDIRFHRLSTIS
jgi:hypothetical protein